MEAGRWIGRPSDECARPGVGDRSAAAASGGLRAWSTAERVPPRRAQLGAAQAGHPSGLVEPRRAAVAQGRWPLVLDAGVPDRGGRLLALDLRSVREVD